MPKWFLPVIMFMLAQGITATIYVSRLGARVDYLAQTLSELRADLATGTRLRYTSEDASRDKALLTALLEATNKRIDLAEQRLMRLENKP
jgi:hypothetical protein